MPELGEGDEEQGEELLPVTNTDDASLLGQTPQSTDVPLPRPPPYTQRVSCRDCEFGRLVYPLVIGLFLFGFDLFWLISSDYNVWFKVLLGLIAFSINFLICMSMKTRSTHVTAPHVTVR